MCAWRLDTNWLLQIKVTIIFIQSPQMPQRHLMPTIFFECFNGQRGCPGCRLPHPRCTLRIRCPKVRCVHPSKSWPFWLRASVLKKTLACIRFRNDPCVHAFSESLKTNIWIRTSELWVLLPGFYHSQRVSLSNPCLWGGIQSTGTIPHATWTLTVSAVRVIFCFENPVVKPKVRFQTLVCNDLKTDARKGHFWNGCTQGSFWALMRATRKAILTDARNGLLGNGCAQGMGKILDARNLDPGCTQPL